jgi:7-cyano-7-deazaguanine synthase in queuosine biosynthesis
MVMCNITDSEDVEICLGATAGDRVLDKSPLFVEKVNDLLNYLYQPQHWIPNGKRVKLNIDFKSKTKTELIKLFVEAGGDIKEAFNRSFSCYDPVDGHECWQCKPCFRKFVSFALNGMEFPKEVSDTVLTYIKKEVEPQIISGTYGRAEEEKEILEVLKLYEN